MNAADVITRIAVVFACGAIGGLTMACLFPTSGIIAGVGWFVGLVVGYFLKV